MITGVKPIDLIASERQQRYVANKSGRFTLEKIKEIEEHSVALWQTRWDETECVRYTHDLLSNVVDLRDAFWVHPNKNLTQFLLGHGDFRDRLQKFVLADSGICSQCGLLDDTYVIYECTRYDLMRVETTFRLDIIGSTLDLHVNWKSRTEWILIKGFITYLAKERIAEGL